MSSRVSREIRSVSYPQGEPRPCDFKLAETPILAPGEGEVLVRNLVMSVDPYMRGRMSTRRSFAAPLRIGAPLEGGAIGEVLESRHPDLEDLLDN